MDYSRQECTTLTAYMNDVVESGQDLLVKIVAEAEDRKTHGIMSYSAGLIYQKILKQDSTKMRSY